MKWIVESALLVEEPNIQTRVLDGCTRNYAAILPINQRADAFQQDLGLSAGAWAPCVRTSQPVGLHVDYTTACQHYARYQCTQYDNQNQGMRARDGNQENENLLVSAFVAVTRSPRKAKSGPTSLSRYGIVRWVGKLGLPCHPSGSHFRLYRRSSCRIIHRCFFFCVRLSSSLDCKINI